MTSAMDLAQKRCSLEIVCISSMKLSSKTEVVMMMVPKRRGAKVGIAMAAISDGAFSGSMTLMVLASRGVSGQNSSGISFPVDDAHWFEDGANLLFSGDEEEGRNLIRVGFEVRKVLS